MSGYVLGIPREKCLNYLQTVTTDQMPYSAASDLGLHCLPISLLGVSLLKWVKVQFKIVADDMIFSPEKKA